MPLNPNENWKDDLGLSSLDVVGTNHFVDGKNHYKMQGPNPSQCKF